MSEIKVNIANNEVNSTQYIRNILLSENRNEK